MAKVRRKIGITKDREFKVVNFNAAGVDVSPKELQVCVPSDRDEKCNRTFGVYTKDLHTVAAACGYQLKNHHHALADAEACAWIAREIL